MTLIEIYSFYSELLDESIDFWISASKGTCKSAEFVYHKVKKHESINMHKICISLQVRFHYIIQHRLILQLKQNLHTFTV